MREIKRHIKRERLSEIKGEREEEIEIYADNRAREGISLTSCLS